MKDYPAAHSMDTQWFISDECGHVAAFFSNESGAIPHGAAQDIRSHDGDGDDTFWNADERSAVSEIAPSHIRWLTETFAGKHTDPKHAFFGQSFILSKLPKRFEDLLEKEAAGATRSPAGRPIARVIDPSPETGGRGFIILSAFEASPEFHDLVHSEGLCICCTSAFNLRGVQVGEKADFIPFYDHPGANGNAYPYFLQFVPSNMKTIDELSLSPEEKTSLHDGVKMKGCFLDKPFWQPTEELECELYGDEYTPVLTTAPEFKGLLKSIFGYW